MPNKTIKGYARCVDPTPTTTKGEIYPVLAGFSVGTMKSKPCTLESADRLMVLISTKPKRKTIRVTADRFELLSHPEEEDPS